MARNLTPPYKLSWFLDHVSDPILNTSGTLKSTLFRRYYSWFSKIHDFFNIFWNFMIFQHIESREHPDFQCSYFWKHPFRKPTNVSNRSIDSILSRLDAAHYPNFEFCFFRDFQSLKTLPLQFRTNSFWLEWASFGRFYHKKCAILTKFVRKLSLNALFRRWFDSQFFTEIKYYRFVVLKCVISLPNQ